MGSCHFGGAKQHSSNHYEKSDFNFLQVIGTGGFGKVWKVSEKSTQQLYALKVMAKAKVISKKSVKAIMRQRTIQSLLSVDPSDSIINLKAAFQDTARLYLLMYFVQGKDLRHYLNNRLSLNENQIKYLVYGILKALEYLHHKKIIHRDLKPENIIIDEHGLPHLTDFGIAEVYKQQNGKYNAGTMGYMAPELLLGQNHSFSVDYYALGVITYELFHGKRPFQGTNSEQLIQQIMKNELKTSDKQSTQISNQASDFINKLLQKRQRNRLGFQNISQIFQHPWMNSVSVLQSNWTQSQVEQPNQHCDQFQDATSDDQDHNIISNILQRPHIQQLFKSFDFTASKCQKSRQPLTLEKCQTLFSLKSYLKI